MTVIVINISVRGIKETARSEMTAFVHWLQQTAKTHGLARTSHRLCFAVRHFADENHGPLTTDQVPGCRIACYRL